MLVFTKKINDGRFKTIPGMPVPARFTTGFARRSIKEKYGDNVIKDISINDVDAFSKLLMNPSEQNAKQREVIQELKTQLEEAHAQIKQGQDETFKMSEDIQKSRWEIAELKWQVSRASSQ